MVKYNNLPIKLRKDLEQQFIVKANQYCQREGLKPDDYVITMLKAENIPFSFIMTLK